MECCGEPFAVGDEVSWPLLLRPCGEVLGEGWDEHLTEVSGPVEDVRDDESGAGAVRVVREGPTTAVPVGDACDELSPGDPVRVVGLLVVNGHGGGPRVTGRVRAVRVVTEVYEENPPGSRTWEPVPGERGLRPVDRCPKWFDDGTPDERGRRPAESGVLATLEIPDPDPDLGVRATPAQLRDRSRSRRRQ
ncbi:DUF6578 domain-containing protein [Streptomyces sp. DSM 15324]|uniref:DUF6578 domain-containing protein n=1 Tax=Streptomyces sp. DSM 15324 TaxID=1739111 RepID=UPI00082B3E99|nr:DUF6578 domain-containing protein [Streptomyces sp. DSM 15324]